MTNINKLYPEILKTINHYNYFQKIWASVPHILLLLVYSFIDRIANFHELLGFSSFCGLLILALIVIILTLVPNSSYTLAQRSNYQKLTNVIQTNYAISKNRSGVNDSESLVTVKSNSKENFSIRNKNTTIAVVTPTKIVAKNIIGSQYKKVLTAYTKYKESHNLKFNTAITYISELLITKMTSF
jgi:hypothetical protein